MKFVKLVFALTVFSIFSLSSAASFDDKEFYPAMPLNYFFETVTGPSLQIRNISDRSFRWFKEYLSDVKKAGYDLNQILPGGETLLHLAVTENVPNLIRALIESDINALTLNIRGETAHLVAYEMSQSYSDSDLPLKIFEEHGFELKEEENQDTAIVEVVQAVPDTIKSQNTEIVEQPLPITPLFRYLPYRITPTIAPSENLFLGI